MNMSLPFGIIFPLYLPDSSDSSSNMSVFPNPVRLLILASRLTMAQEGLHSNVSFSPYRTDMNILGSSSAGCTTVSGIFIYTGSPLQEGVSQPIHTPRPTQEECIVISLSRGYPQWGLCTGGVQVAPGGKDPGEV